MSGQRLDLQPPEKLSAPSGISVHVEDDLLVKAFTARLDHEFMAPDFEEFGLLWPVTEKAPKWVT